MSYEELLKNKIPLTPSTPEKKEEAKDLSIPKTEASKNSYQEISKQLTTHDQEMLDLLKNYDKIKKHTNKSDELDNLQMDARANQNLSTRNKEEMSNLRKKVDSHLLSLPKKI